MPLSEHEQRLLEQMERALYAEDPKFATSMRNPRSVAGDKRRVALGVISFLAGMGLLVAGVATQLVAVGVAGFLAMLAGIWLAINAWRSSTQTPAPAAPGAQAPRPARPSKPRPQRQRRGDSLTQRMEERWRRRRETGDF